MTGARRDRDVPDIHPASPAVAGRHETLCGCSHSRPRRRTAPCRTSGCNLSPALDLDSEALLHGLRCAGPCGLLRATRRAAPWAMTRMPAPASRGVGRAGRIGPKPARPSPQASGPQAPPGPPDACPPASREPRPNPLPPGYQTDRGPLHSFTPPSAVAAVAPGDAPGGQLEHPASCTSRLPSRHPAVTTQGASGASSVSAPT